MKKTQQHDICSQRRLIRLGGGRNLGSWAFQWKHSKDWSDCANAQTDLRLRRANMSFCWFCHSQTQVRFLLVLLLFSVSLLNKLSRLTTKPAKWLCAQRRQISLGIRPVWSVFAVRMKKARVLSYPLSAQQRLLIRLGGCAGWSESSLGAHAILLVLSWGRSRKSYNQEGRLSG